MIKYRITWNPGDGAPIKVEAVQRYCRLLAPPSAYQDKAVASRGRELRQTCIEAQISNDTAILTTLLVSMIGLWPCRRKWQIIPYARIGSWGDYKLTSIVPDQLKPMRFRNPNRAGIKPQGTELAPRWFGAVSRSG